MKHKVDYKPQFSLSIAILRTFMGKRELNSIITAYVEAKKKLWKKKIR